METVFTPRQEIQIKLEAVKARVQSQYNDDNLHWGVLGVIFSILGPIFVVSQHESPYLGLMCLAFYAIWFPALFFGCHGETKRIKNDPEIIELTNQLAKLTAAEQEQLKLRDGHLSSAEAPLDEEADWLLRTAAAGEEPSQQLLRRSEQS